MIGRLRGKIDGVYSDHIILDVGGVGYKVFIPVALLHSMLDGSSISLEIEMVVKEDQISLYGFNAIEEKRWFTLLQTVQGVGAKAAMAILGTINSEALSKAILSQDHAIFKRVSGIGPKLASRIVNELRSRVESTKDLSPLQEAVSGMTSTDVMQDAISAISALGFSRSDAYIAVSNEVSLDKNITLEDLIRNALSKLSK